MPRFGLISVAALGLLAVPSFAQRSRPAGGAAPALPLRSGTYVEINEACNTELLLARLGLRRNGYDVRGGSSNFRRITRLDATTYRVLEMPMNETITWTISGDNRFTRRGADGSDQGTYRWCPGPLWPA